MIAVNAFRTMRDLTWTRLSTGIADDRLHVRLRFGRPACVWQVDGITHHWFTPGVMFAVTWWARHSPRRQYAAFAVVETLRVGDAGHRLPCIRPAVRVHLFVNARCVGKDRRAVDRAEELVAQIEKAGLDPCVVAPAYFRAAGQSLRVGRTPRRLEGLSTHWLNRSVSHEA